MRSRDTIRKWSLNQLVVHKVGYLRPFTRDVALKRVLLVSELDPISQAQIFPFYLYRRQLKEQHGIELRELPLTRFRSGQHPYQQDVDAVLFQTWFDLSLDEMDNLAARIRKTWPSARLAYLDWFAPTDLRYASVLDRHVVAYVKKQVLTDFKRYNQTTIGDTNLTNYYSLRFNLDLPKVEHEIPQHFLEKLVLGASFEYSPRITQNLTKEWPAGPRSIDVHARLATKGDNWYSLMRREAVGAVEHLNSQLTVASLGSVSSRKYLSELYNSKICFSPFGYGEVCWRDFEAMSCGALLLKPDMSHLTLRNNHFEPFETYVPLAWDLNDLKEKVEHYLGRSKDREDIARNAFERLKKHLLEHRFVSDSAELWQRLDL